jgi:predicted dehydrogenase
MRCLMRSFINVICLPTMKRIALIGSGIFAKETYIKHISEYSDKVTLTAILSRSEASIEDALTILGDKGKFVTRFFGTTAENDFFNCISELCDGVVIVVPIPLLAYYVEKCRHHNLNILSEKPIAMTSEDGQRLLSLYTQIPNRNFTWHVAENYRLEPAICYAAHLVSNHHIRPKSFTLIALRQQSANSKFAVTAWRTTPQYHGSYVLDGGIHFVAMLRIILGGCVTDIQSTYEETSVVEVGACGSCRAGNTLGTFQIRYGAFPSALCRMDIYWDDATMSVVQHKGVGYEVSMTGVETKHFPFEGLSVEFLEWLAALEGGHELAAWSPEEALHDLIVVEKICCTPKSH